MAPRIRFFQGAGGKRIAYATDGAGPWLVLPAWWVSHLEQDYADPAFRDLFDALAARTTVVRYDRAGAGLSDRERGSYVLDDELETLERLIDELGADRVALFGVSCGCPLAITYAARHQARTSHLVLYGGYLCGARLAPDELKTAMIGIVRAHWGMGAKFMTDVFAPTMTTEQQRRFAETQRASASAEMGAALLEMTYRWDVADLAAHVTAPTLVLHRQKDRTILFEHGRALAAEIPGATLVTLEGKDHLPWIGTRGPLVEAVLDFVAPHSGAPAPHEVVNAFERSGDVWTIAFAGRRSHVKHARGLADLATLLAHPGEEFHASQLMDGAGARIAHGADPVLDDRARTAIRARLAALGEVIETAEARGDAAVALRAQDEREALLAELRAAAGLGGRKRALADPAEKARKAVTGRIRDSIDKLRATLPELAGHLDESVVTGTYCSYAPARPVRWRT